MANRLQTARDFDPYAKGVTMDELKRIRRQLAKVMNQRMVRLEQAVSPITGEDYTFGSYEKMQSYLTKQGKAPIKGTEKRRFAEALDPGMSRRLLKKEIRILQGFEQHKSSTVAGMRAIEEKRIQTFKAEGLSIRTGRSKDFYDFLNSETYTNLLKTFTSEDIIEEYDKRAIRARKEKKDVDIAEEFQKYLDKGTRMSLKGLRKSMGTTTLRKKPFRVRKKRK